MRERIPELLTHLGVPTLFQPLTRGRAVVFMLHRFADPEAGIRGHDAEDVDRAIDYLRSRGFELLSLSDLFIRLRSGVRLRKAVAFTMDDGYADQAAVGVPLFEKHGCPLTIFVTTGFLDGTHWLWWDRIECVFLETKRGRLEVEVGGERLVYRPSGTSWGEEEWSDFIERCKRVSEEEKHRAIDRLAEAAGVELSPQPPRPFAPMTWDEARAAEARGIVTFAPHTVTHPILSQTDDAQARFELEESWRRLRAEVDKAQPVFGYPNGCRHDYGSREVGILREMGLIGAMAVTERYVETGYFGSANERAFHVPRFSFPRRFRTMVQSVSGVDRFRELIRAADRSP